MWRSRRRRAVRRLPCAEVVELVTDYLEGALSPDARYLIEQHLAGCDGCAEYLDQILQTVRLLRGTTVADGDAVVTLTEDACARLAEAFRGSMRTRP